MLNDPSDGSKHLVNVFVSVTDRQEIHCHRSEQATRNQQLREPKDEPVLVVSTIIKL